MARLRLFHTALPAVESVAFVTGSLNGDGSSQRLPSS